MKVMKAGLGWDWIGEGGSLQQGQTLSPKPWTESRSHS